MECVNCNDKRFHKKISTTCFQFPWLSKRKSCTFLLHYLLLIIFMKAYVELRSLTDILTNLYSIWVLEKILSTPHITWNIKRTQWSFEARTSDRLDQNGQYEIFVLMICWLRLKMVEAFLYLICGYTICVKKTIITKVCWMFNDWWAMISTTIVWRCLYCLSIQKMTKIL